MNPKVLNSRRRHSAELKAAVLAQCEAGGASVAAIALSHGLNANLVRKWMVGRGIKRSGLPTPRTANVQTPDAPTTAMLATAAPFVPVQLPPAAVVAKDMKVQLCRGTTTVTLNWPAESASELMTWMRDLVK